MDNDASRERSGQELPISSFMPELPDSSAPELRAEDRLVILLASAAQAEGRLSPVAWKKATDILTAIFSDVPMRKGADGTDPRTEQEFFLLQTRFHAALLQAPVPAASFAADSRIVEDLAALPGQKAELLLASLEELAPPYAEIVRVAMTKGGRASEGRRADTSPVEKRSWENFLGSAEGSGTDAHNVMMENGVAVQRPRPRTLLPVSVKKSFDALSSMVSGAGSACTGMAEGVAQAANAQYQGASRYLRELRVQRLFGLQRGEEAGSVVATPLTGTMSAASDLEQAALETGSLETARALGDLRYLMLEQPFTLVVVGEGKRGKSSLVNALLGKAVSPVRESVPETAAVARFRWGETFRSCARFLSEEESLRIGGFFKENASDDSFGERVQRLLNDRPPAGEKEIRSEKELGEFLSAESGNSFFSARVDVELPSDILRHGLTLVDTPGLNATDPIQNYLAFEECLAADCLLFVMDARRPESASEQELLHQLARSGRATSVIGVLTGEDRLNEEESRVHAMERARLLMDDAEAQGIHVLGLVSVNAREAMAQRCASSDGGGEAFRDLLRLIESAASSRKEEKDAERMERIRTKGLELVEVSRSDALGFLAAEQSERPDARHAEILKRHVERLESVMESCSGQAWSIASAALFDMEAWRKEQARALDNWQEKTTLKLVDAANKHADSLGFSKMFKPKNWKNFDEEDVPRIARECLEELLAERRDVQQDWNRKLKQFGQRMQELSVLCLDAVITDDVELQSISDVPFSRERWLVNANSLMKKAGLVAMGLAIRRGGGLGLGIVLGNMGWWALLPVAVVGSLVWTLMKLGSPSRCRRLLMERKEESIRRWTAEQRKRLDDLLNQNLEDIAKAYGKAVNEGFVPALSLLAEEASAMRVYLAVLEKMREGAERRAEEQIACAKELERQLLALNAG
ncbi:MAG: dynamin family protein [Mailhella sp.]|nr:dynamin family protein [Mailhella sp.]